MINTYCILLVCSMKLGYSKCHTVVSLSPTRLFKSWRQRWKRAERRVRDQKTRAKTDTRTFFPVSFFILSTSLCSKLTTSYAWIYILIKVVILPLFRHFFSPSTWFLHKSMTPGSSCRTLILMLWVQITSTPTMWQ